MKWAEERAFAWKLEEESLDKIHAVLGQHPDGLKLTELAGLTGIGRGYLEHLLKNSQVVLKLLPGTYRWVADWNDVPPDYRPAAWKQKSPA